MEKKKNTKKILKISIFTFLIILFIILLFVAIIYNIKQIDIVIILEASMSTEQESQIESEIKEICKTNDVKYISKEESVKQVQDSFEIDIDLSEYCRGIGSYKTKIKLKDFKDIKEKLLNVNGVKNVREDSNDILNKTSNQKSNKIEYTGLTKEEIENTVISKVNSGKIYVPDIQKVINIKSAVLKETVENIEIWRIYIEYEKSSLSAPIGQSYEGKTFYGSYYFAYNKETKKFFKYMFEEKEYSTLKGWSTQGHKEDSSYWVD